MMRLLFIVFCISLASNINAQSIVQHLLHADNYSSLHIKGDCSVDLRYHPDSVGYILIRSTMPMYEKIERVLTSGSLYISIPLSVNASKRPKEIQPIIVYAPKSLNNINLSDRCFMNSDNVNVYGDMSLSTSGHSSIRIKSFKASSVNASVTGSGSILINDRASVSHINCSVTGSGKVVIDQLRGNSFSATLRGTGLISVGGNVSGTSSVVVKGRGCVDVGDMTTTLLKAAVYGDGSIVYSPNTKCEAIGNKGNIKESTE